MNWLSLIWVPLLLVPQVNLVLVDCSVQDKPFILISLYFYLLKPLSLLCDLLLQFILRLSELQIRLCEFLILILKFVHFVLVRFYLFRKLFELFVKFEQIGQFCLKLFLLIMKLLDLILKGCDFWPLLFDSHRMTRLFINDLILVSLKFKDFLVDLFGQVLESVE